MFRLIFLITCVILSVAGDSYVYNNKTFPAKFMIGAATAAYQIEGAWNADGKGESVWDHKAHDPNSHVMNKSTGDVACDSYHLYKTDVDMLKHLGVSHYRFSIAWTRILPNGTETTPNENGVKYYKNLIDLLVKNNIEPLVTLHHFDTPMGIENQGGYWNSSFPVWFAHYARICFKEFGDKVKYWATFNEPIERCGIRGPIRSYTCTHSIIKAHAAAWHVYDKEFRQTQKGKITIVLSSSYYGPDSNKPEDIEAANRAHDFKLGWYAAPLHYGDYPEIMKSRVANRSKLEGYSQSRLPEFTEEEKKYIKGTSDYFAFNTYFSCRVKWIPDHQIVNPGSLDYDLGVSTYTPPSRNGGWGMALLLKWIDKNYNKPEIFITENGWRSNNQGLEDPGRIEFLKDYLSRIHDAMDEGVKVLGYTHWSLMDNFEWDMGYNPKFGLYRVDFNDTGRKRTPRMSAEWLKKMIKSRCIVDKCVE